ncbi:MAG TPA: MarR family transcriptional regulator [Candidatus Nitrosocosmicus sp.]|nr:MarR family transcriptional regulator [Candidatus Nitrosocosmicus sp.]
MNGKKEINIERLELLLRTICFNIKKKGREILQDFNITPPQFDALQFLVDEGELTIGDLSGKLFLAPSTITDLVDRMEKNGLVTRVRDEKDRRSVKIRVEEKGFKLINEVILRRCTYLEEMIKDMKPEDRIRLTGYLEIMGEKL